MIRVCLIGLGKTGREIAKVILEQQDMMLVSAICNRDSSLYGSDIGAVVGNNSTGIIIDSSDDLEKIIFKSKPDVIVDFSNAESTIKNAKIFSKMRINMVIGTTGFSDMELRKMCILTHRYHNGIVYAPNITLGVNVLMLLTNLASNILNDYDFRITEVHHKNKKDSPSGTAMKIAREIEKGLEASGKSMNDNNVPITSLRVGGVVGKHEVMICGDNDKIEITHESFSRRAFADGALRAIKFINDKSGFYEMSDVLDLKRILRDYLMNENEFQNKLQDKYQIKVKESDGTFAL